MEYIFAHRLMAMGTFSQSRVIHRHSAITKDPYLDKPGSVQRNPKKPDRYNAFSPNAFQMK